MLLRKRIKVPVAVVLAACSLLLSAATYARAGEVCIFAAASLKESMNELCEKFSRQQPGFKCLKNFGGSGVLAKQIESGAPADIFISANEEWVDYLKARKALNGPSIAILAYNTLVFAGAPGKASSLQDLPRLKTIAIGSPKSVPAGEYAVEAMTRAGVMKQLEKKLVMAKDVRECLMYVERGEVDGGFVYRTDALQARLSRILFTVQAQLYPRITYPMALTVAGAKNRDAAAFLAYLRSSEAKSVLSRYGFAVK